MHKEERQRDALMGGATNELYASPRNTRGTAPYTYTPNTYSMHNPDNSSQCTIRLNEYKEQPQVPDDEREPVEAACSRTRTAHHR